MSEKLTVMAEEQMQGIRPVLQHRQMFMSLCSQILHTHVRFKYLGFQFIVYVHMFCVLKASGQW